MPIYNYQCTECDTRFSSISSIISSGSPADKAVCPDCKSIKTKKLVSRSSFSLKGNSWYKDGYS